MKLHNDIMNIPSLMSRDTFINQSEYMCYISGHRDARHAAAELSLKYQSYVEHLETLISEYEGSGLINQLKEHFNVGI